jgi:hypothetical protein
MTAWTEHVKAYALEHKMSYKEAMTKAGATYKKSEKVEKVMEEVKPTEVMPEVLGDGVVHNESPLQIKHVRKSKKVEKKEAFPLDVEAIVKAIEPEVKAVLEKKKKSKKA